MNPESGQDQNQNQVVSTSTNPDAPNHNRHKIKLEADLRFVCIILLVLVIGMLIIWKPWQSTVLKTHTISMTGEAIIKSTPDEFIFYPYFDRTGSNVAQMRDGLNAKGNQVNNDLQKIGVSQKDIVLDSSNYANYDYSNSKPSSQTFTLNVTITVDNQTLAQKVQNYLATADAKGQLTSQPQFSTNKEKQLEGQARIAAITDAKNKAKQTAATLGVKVGKVISVTDQTSQLYPATGVANGASASTAAGSNAALPVTPGQNEVTGDVQVVFAIN